MFKQWLKNALGKIKDTKKRSSVRSIGESPQINKVNNYYYYYYYYYFKYTRITSYEVICSLKIVQYTSWRNYSHITYLFFFCNKKELYLHFVFILFFSDQYGRVKRKGKVSVYVHSRLDNLRALQQSFNIKKKIESTGFLVNFPGKLEFYRVRRKASRS